MKTNHYSTKPFQTILFLTASALFLFLLVYPKGREIYKNKVDLEQKRIKVDNANAALIEFPNVAKDFVLVKTQTENELKHLLTSGQIGEILTLASSILEGTSLELLSIDPEQQFLSQPFSLGPKIEFHLFPVTMKLSGKYEEIAQFIDTMMNSEKWALLDQVTIKKSSGIVLQAELKVLFYLRTEGDGPKEPVHEALSITSGLISKELPSHV